MVHLIPTPLADVEDFLRIAMIAVFVVIWIVAQIAAMLKGQKKQRQESERIVRGEGPPPRGGRTQDEDVVFEPAEESTAEHNRRTRLEEQLRRRQAEAERFRHQRQQPQQTQRPAQRPEPRRPERPKPQHVPQHVPQPRPEPTIQSGAVTATNVKSTEIGTGATRLRSAGQEGAPAAARQSPHRERNARLRRMLKGDNLREIIAIKEILDPPVSLRKASEEQ